MKRAILATTMVLVLAVSAVSLAAPNPSRGDRKDAREFCKDLRAAAGKTNLARLMHTSKRRAYGKCKRIKTVRETNGRLHSARQAVIDCKAEQAQGLKAFQEKYNQKGHGIGKCVSLSRRKAEQRSDRANEKKVNAARTCRAEQRSFPASDHPHPGKEGADTSSFAEYWGTNRNNRNAFGKCVSYHARQ